MSSDRISVRATVHLPGLPVGRRALVDPDDPWIADCIARDLLVADPAEAPATEQPGTVEPIEAGGEPDPTP